MKTDAQFNQAVIRLGLASELAWIILAALLLLLGAGCAANGKAESGNQNTEMREVLLPPMPGAARSSQIEGGESQAAGAAIIGPPAPRKLKLIWNKNDPDPDTVTEFWATEDFVNWYWFAESKEPRLEIMADKPHLFFKYRNRLYNQYSEWATE